MPKPPSDCHPDRPVYARGQCQKCYMHDRWIREREKESKGDLLEAKRLEVPRTEEHAVEIARAELYLALPEAARAVRRIIVEGNPDKSNVLRAAEAVLRGVAVAGVTGLRRLLEEPGGQPEGPQQAQVVIGLHIGTTPADVRVGQVVGTLAPAPKNVTPPKEKRPSK